MNEVSFAGRVVTDWPDHGSLEFAFAKVIPANGCVIHRYLQVTATDVVVIGTNTAAGPYTFFAVKSDGPVKASIGGMAGVGTASPTINGVIAGFIASATGLTIRGVSAPTRSVEVLLVGVGKP